MRIGRKTLVNITNRLQSQFKRQETLLDWSDSGFGRGFALYLFIVVGFQLNYMYLYFLVGNRELPFSYPFEYGVVYIMGLILVVQKPVDIIRIAGLLRATESAVRIPKPSTGIEQAY